MDEKAVDRIGELTRLSTEATARFIEDRGISEKDELLCYKVGMGLNHLCLIHRTSPNRIQFLLCEGTLVGLDSDPRMSGKDTDVDPKTISEEERKKSSDVSASAMYKLLEDNNTTTEEMEVVIQGTLLIAAAAEESALSKLKFARLYAELMLCGMKAAGFTMEKPHEGLV